MDTTSPLAILQRQRLGQLTHLGVCTDESLAAHLHSLGQPCSRGLLSHYRQGKRAAPLGLLDLILSHCTGPEQARVLELWALPLGLQVMCAGAPVAGRNVLGWVMEIGCLLGDCLRIARALVTRHPTEEERWKLRTLAHELRQGAAQLEMLVMEGSCALEKVA